MNANLWPKFTLAAAALALLGCSTSEPTEHQTETTVASLTNPTADARHLRVLVSYEGGRFQVERVTEIATPLKQPRSGLTRNGIQYVAQKAGQSAFRGAAPDPRRVHLESPDSTGALQRVEAAAPGRQHMLVYVPIGTDTVDFFEPTAPQAAGAQTSTARASVAGSSAPIGSIDLRSAAK